MTRSEILATGYQISDDVEEREEGETSGDSDEEFSEALLEEGALRTAI
jgi:hypothetical protein